jgi:hypothetical protein
VSAAPTVEVLQAMLELSDALRAKLLDEKAALLAQPSPLFRPKGATAEAQQLERQAFAAGLHHAATLWVRRA